MPHVDEGTLHAYLDGELPSAEHETVETHLAECASCRASLAEQRALIERASALLGAARPVERAAPPFEQLRPRSPQRSPWRVRTPVAWAASIALALGLGYYLRQPSAESIASAPPPPEAALLERYQLRADEKKPDTAPARLGRRDRLLAPAPASKTTVATAESAGLKAEEALRVALQMSADSLVSREVERQQQAKLGAISAPTASAGGAANAAPAAAAPAPAKDSVSLNALIVDGVAARRVAELRGRATTTSWAIISKGTARSLLGTDPVGLPGLARQIRRSPGPDGTVVVEQKIDSTTTIQIFQRQSGMDSSSRPRYYYRAAPSDTLFARQQEREIAGADRLARYVGRLRVEIAGPLSTDSLNKLLDQVQPLP